MVIPIRIREHTNPREVLAIKKTDGHPPAMGRIFFGKYHQACGVGTPKGNTRKGVENECRCIVSCKGGKSYRKDRSRGHRSQKNWLGSDSIGQLRANNQRNCISELKSAGYGSRRSCRHAPGRLKYGKGSCIGHLDQAAKRPCQTESNKPPVKIESLVDNGSFSVCSRGYKIFSLGHRIGKEPKQSLKLCKRMLIPGNWFQAINLFCFRAIHGMPKIPILLQTQPEICRHTQNTGQP